ncbi:MAG: Gfo/Idh/MocA family oxidoreductase [Verrucomicrobiota bacterium]
MKARTYTLVLGIGLAGYGLWAAELRLGMIGLDTSHCTAFTRLINDPKDKDHVAGGKVTVAYKCFSPDIESSANRVEGYAKQLQEQYQVKLVGSIAELLQEVDGVLIESVDGRPHLEQARPVILAKKPLFIDKPVAGSLDDAIAIYKLAKEHGTPVFSSSAYRYYDSLVALAKTNVGVIRSVISYGPCSLEPHHPDLFWYGIHASEALFTVMGPGCESVVRTSTPDTEVVTGLWKDGRTGVLMGLRNGPTPHKVIIFGSKAVAEQQGSGTYAPLVREIMKFMQTGVAPVSPAETLELFGFMAAADESKRQGGAPVKIKPVANP